MAQQFLTPLDMTGQEILNLRLQSLPADPTAGEAKLYYNSVSKTVRYHDGTAWVDTGGAAGFTSEDAQDAAAAALTTATHVGLSVVYDDVADTITFTVSALDQLPAPAGPLGLNGQKITGLADGTLVGDAATKGQVDAAISGLVDTAPGTLDTLNELAAALGDDANYAATTAATIGAIDTRVGTLEAGAFAQDIGDGTATAIVVTHSLGTRDVIAQVRRATTPWDLVQPDVEMTTTNTVTLRFAVAPTAAQYRAVIRR